MAFGLFSLGSFASYLQNTLLRGMPMVAHNVLEQAGQMVEDEAKRVLGTYDYGWPPLKPATIARKAHGDTPLLETGELRDSIHHYVTVDPVTGGGQVNVGSNHERALWHELGTVTIPARPFLSAASVLMEPLVQEMIGARVVAFLETGVVESAWWGPIHRAPGEAPGGRGYSAHKQAWEAAHPPTPSPEGRAWPTRRW
jgi:phage gpG-like protein